MPDFVVFGIDILDSPSINALNGAGNEGQGTVTITGGIQPFEDGDVVVFSAVNVTADGEIPPNGEIDRITVYESLADYQAGIVKYNYSPQNPGQTATVQGDLSGLGDGYINFNSGVLTPDDGSPFVSRMFVAPGTDLSIAANQPGGLTLDRNQDFDFNGDGNFDDPNEHGNNLFYVGDYTVGITCFTVGSRILTPNGEIPIEQLGPGDRVITDDYGSQQVRWVGRSTVPATGHMAPVYIAADSFGQHDSLIVSQNHRILCSGPTISSLFAVAEVLGAAKHLVDDRKVAIRKGGKVEYVHILFDQHQLIWTNGCLSESLFPQSATDDLEQQAALQEMQKIFPNLSSETASGPTYTARPCLKRYEAQMLLSKAASHASACQSDH